MANDTYEEGDFAPIVWDRRRSIMSLANRDQPLSGIGIGCPLEGVDDRTER